MRIPFAGSESVRHDEKIDLPAAEAGRRAGNLQADRRLRGSHQLSVQTWRGEGCDRCDRQPLREEPASNLCKHNLAN